MPVMRINLWSSPRNLSTAMMYAFAQRADTIVVDEPLYAHYLRVTGLNHPGRDEILATMESDGRKVISDVILGEYDKPVVFFKQMTHHFIELDDSFMDVCDNIIFIRDPREIIASYTKINGLPSHADIGIRMQLDLYERLASRGKVSAVLDARTLQRDPAGTLRKLCERLGLAFDPAMLHWERGGRPEDGCWAKYWYANIHNSTGFAPWQEKTITLNPEQEKLAAECEPVYRTLLQHAL